MNLPKENDNSLFVLHKQLIITFWSRRRQQNTYTARELARLLPKYTDANINSALKHIMFCLPKFLTRYSVANDNAPKKFRYVVHFNLANSHNTFNIFKRIRCTANYVKRFNAFCKNVPETPPMPVKPVAVANAVPRFEQMDISELSQVKDDVIPVEYINSQAFNDLVDKILEARWEKYEKKVDEIMNKRLSNFRLYVGMIDKRMEAEIGH